MSLGMFRKASILFTANGEWKFRNNYVDPDVLSFTRTNILDPLAANLTKIP